MDAEQVLDIISEVEEETESEFSESESEESSEEGSDSDEEESDDGMSDSSGDDEAGSMGQSSMGQGRSRGCGVRRGARGPRGGRGVRGRGRGVRVGGRTRARRQAPVPVPSLSWKVLKSGRFSRHSRVHVYRYMVIGVILPSFFKGEPDQPPTPPPFTERPGSTATLSQDPSPEECFRLCFTEELYQFLVDHTNEYARHRLSGEATAPCSLYRKWRDVTVNEMKGFVAVILNMGMLQLSNLKDYWSLDSTLNVPFFR